MANPVVLKCSKCKGFDGYKEHLIPVEAFGDTKVAKVIMLSLNPSHREYTALRKGAKNTPLYSPLSESGVRTRESLSKEEVEDIENSQKGYFQSGEHLDWFDPAERFLNLINTSDLGTLSFGINSEANVINVDIVKCPTGPIWGQIKEFHTEYISNCGSLLIPQLFVLCNRKIHSCAAGNAENCNLTWSLYGHDFQAKKPAVSRAGFA